MQTNDTVQKSEKLILLYLLLKYLWLYSYALRGFSVFLISESEYRYARWKQAVIKSMGWETSDSRSNGKPKI